MAIFPPGRGPSPESARPGASVPCEDGVDGLRPSRGWLVADPVGHQCRTEEDSRATAASARMSRKGPICRPTSRARSMRSVATTPSCMSVRRSVGGIASRSRECFGPWAWRWCTMPIVAVGCSAARRRRLNGGFGGTATRPWIAAGDRESPAGTSAAGRGGQGLSWNARRRRGYEMRPVAKFASAFRGSATASPCSAASAAGGPARAPVPGPPAESDRRSSWSMCWG